ncbi:NUFM [Cyberlindnera jadinii]|uniref:NADH dehydrogenase 1 alpha subcomplex 5 n=1 Tax=Cyberlindnera jadinii (strain ATCC 18201 / CBS 1600 / BCRC 20928 / JCM 3617 / NBRC 0987 / NRRL Y-1542) TaxID=983966 RepID=A0A0H5CK12_CYBJN|nr:NADH dehydrogenase 1 alpha subcomplex 5 [Cyberlindnera jadinii NRRL Y-1542]ODV70698.1 NADH dehydrogenase 1 alpha subcomplex 5 [Cyberlindnera jadinii NRRL Y-1542]CEP24814.1 NUFM [Cyberlindnera jadinii]
MRLTQILRSTQVLVRTSQGNPTGITGLFQHPNPRPALLEIYKATLEYVGKEFPQESVYKKSVTNFTKSRMDIVESTESVEEIEQKIGNGLIEEVLIQASDELELAKKMKLWESWKELEDKPLEDQWVYFGKKI